MGGLSIWHWMIVLLVVMVLFGGGNKVSNLMGDFAKGIKSFKKHMADDSDDVSMESTAERRARSTIPGPDGAVPPVEERDTLHNRP
jgi:sec-independent protein translocase protein TatA